MKTSLATIKKGSPVLSSADIDHLARLANLPLSKEEAEKLKKQVGITVQYVSQLQTLPTDDVIETSQVTGLENVYREDEVDASRTFTQEQALGNSKRTHNGFFVVDAVFEEK